MNRVTIESSITRRWRPIALAVLGQPDALRPDVAAQSRPSPAYANDPEDRDVATRAPGALRAVALGQARRRRAPGRPARLGRDAPRRDYSGDPCRRSRERPPELPRRPRSRRPLRRRVADPPLGSRLAPGARRRHGKAPGPRSSANRGWIVGPNGHTLVYLRGPLMFRMGSPESEPNRFDYETQHERRIERSLLVATTETTVEQYQEFKQDHEPDRRYSTESAVLSEGFPGTRRSATATG